jgi:hypothetical protein
MIPTLYVHELHELLCCLRPLHAVFNMPKKDLDDIYALSHERTKAEFKARGAGTALLFACVILGTFLAPD